MYTVVWSGKVRGLSVSWPDLLLSQAVVAPSGLAISRCFGLNRSGIPLLSWLAWIRTHRDLHADAQVDTVDCKPWGLLPLL